MDILKTVIGGSGVVADASIGMGGMGIMNGAGMGMSMGMGLRRRNLLGDPGDHGDDIMTDVTHYIWFKNLFSIINGVINCLNTYICFR